MPTHGRNVRLIPSQSGTVSVQPFDEVLRVDPTLKNKTVAWARLTESERDQLEVLCADEGVAASIWFRRRMAEHLGELEVAPAGRTRRS